MQSPILISFFTILLFGGSFAVEYNATWESLDSRPLPKWFDEAKVGIFVHWGVYSVPSFGDEWFWWQWRGSQSEEFVNFMKKNYPPNFTYQDFARDFTAEFFNPEEWAEIFKNSGAKYVVLTSKHHEGFHLWPSKYSYSWNSMDVGPKRDLVGDLANAVREEGLHFGVYHSLYEWFHPLYMEDWANDYKTTAFVDSKIIPEMKELVELYKPDILWSDGDWEAPDTYWKSKEFLQWLYNESPVKDVVVTNDRWGSGTGCAHGGYLSCADRYNPGFLLPRKWENAMPLDWGSWGYRRTAKLTEIVYIQDLIKQLASTVSCGGNILINIGPTKDGSLVPIFQERLRDLGEWLSINGEGIYGTEPWTTQNDTLTPGVWYTSKGSSVYAIVLNWPWDNVVALRSIKPLFSMNSMIEVSLLGNEDLEVRVNESSADSVAITLPDKAKVASQWAWVLKFTH